MDKPILCNQILSGLTQPKKALALYSGGSIADSMIRQTQVDLLQSQKFVVSENLVNNAYKASTEKPSVLLEMVENAQIPFDNQEVISLTWNMLQELPDTEYNQIIEGLVQNSADAEQKVRRMSEEALEELRKEASEDAFGGYDDSPEGEDDGDTLTPPEEGDTLTPPEEEGGVGLRPEPEIEDEF